MSGLDELSHWKWHDPRSNGSWLVDSLGSLQTLGKTASADGGDGLHRKGQGRPTPILLLRSRGSLKGEVWTQFSSTKLIFLSSLPPQKKNTKKHTSHTSSKNKVQEKNKRHQPFLVGIDSNEFHPALHDMDRKKLVAATAMAGWKLSPKKTLMSLDAGDVASNWMPPPPTKKLCFFLGKHQSSRLFYFFGGKQKEF